MSIADIVLQDLISFGVTREAAERYILQEPLNPINSVYNLSNSDNIIINVEEIIAINEQGTVLCRTTVPSIVPKIGTMRILNCCPEECISTPIREYTPALLDLIYLAWYYQIDITDILENKSITPAKMDILMLMKYHNVFKSEDIDCNDKTYIQMYYQFTLRRFGLDSIKSQKDSNKLSKFQNEDSEFKSLHDISDISVSPE